MAKPVTEDGHPRQGGLSARRATVGAVVAIVAVAAIAFALGSGGGGSSQDAPASRLLDPSRFAAKVAAPGVVTINVHVPAEGSIPGTDKAIPYSSIKARRGELPSKSTTLAIYCRSGRMSAIAVRTLTAMGYKKVFELSGGMEAWQASGRRLLPAA